MSRISYDGVVVVYRYYMSERLKLEGETEKMGVCMTAVELMATPCTKSLWEAEVVGTSMEEMRAVARATTGASFAGRERAAVGVERIRSAPALASICHVLCVKD